MKRIAAAQILNLKNRIPNRTFHFREYVGHLAANHHRNQAVDVQVLRPVRGNIFAVAIYRDIIRYPEYLIHLVRNVNDCHILFLQVFYNPEEVLHFRLRDSRSRLIHNDNLGIIGNRFGNLNHLHLCNRQVPHLFIRIQIQTEAVKKFFCTPAHLRMIHHKRILHGETAEPQVFAHRTLGNR